MTDQSHQIPSQLQMGKEYGMQLMDQALLAAIQAKEVDPEQAYIYATDKRQFQRFVTDISVRRSAQSPPLPEAAMAAIDAFLKQVLERDGSDLHFLAGDPPRVRQYGELKPLAIEPLDAEMVKTTLYEIMPKLALERFEAKDGTDFAYSMPGVARFRVNVMRQLNGMGGVFRVIPSKARTADELKLPDAVRNLCKVNNGLILVTGKTGSGKSTTLAAMIDDINTREKGHILTIEDPIEFVHTRKNCLISQREIGVHAALVLERAAVGAARGSRCDPGRRVARPRDHEHRGDRGGDWASWSWARCTRTAPRPRWTAS